MTLLSSLQSLLSSPQQFQQKARSYSVDIARACQLSILCLVLFGAFLPQAEARPRLGLNSNGFSLLTFEQLVDFAAEKGIRELQLHAQHLNPDEEPIAKQLKKFYLQDKGVRSYSGVYAWETHPEKNRRIFELAKAFEMDLLVLEVADFKALDQIETLAQEFDLQVALRPTSANLAALPSASLSPRDKLLGLSLKLDGHEATKPEITKFFAEHADRIFDLQFIGQAEEFSKETSNAAVKAWSEALKKVDWIGVLALSSEAKLEAEALEKFVTQGQTLFRENFIKHQFQAAAVKKDITPTKPEPLRGYPNPRVSTGVNDRINHRIVVMDDGEELFVLISSDLCNIPPATSDRFIRNIARRIGTAPSNLWWTVTHTHSAPHYGVRPNAAPPEAHGKTWDSSYDALVEDALMQGILEAKSQLAPAKLGVGWGYAAANINRRARTASGGTALGMNPEGPVDRRIGLIRLDHASTNQPIALIANYAMHGTVLGSDNTLISGDAQGYVSQSIEQEIDAPVLYINGAAGNLAPIYSVPSATSSLKNLPHFKVLLADKILEANQRLKKTTDQVRFQPRLIRVESATNSQRPWPETLLDYRRSEETYPKVGIPLRMLQINNNILLWALPLEMFCEISNEVRERSSVPYTFYYGYTGGGMGYLPSPEEFQYGGYEVGVSYFTPATPSLVIDAVLEVANPKAKP